LLIAGKDYSSTGEKYEVRNPADTREIVGIVQKGKVEDAKRAIDAAQEAFEKWSNASPALRGKIVHDAAALIQKNEEEIAVLVTKENGKPLKDAKSETRAFVSILEYYAALWPTLRGSHVPTSDTSRFAVIMKKPVGVCAAILPWNNPILQAAAKLAPALIAGNTMVVKPASTTPLAIIMLVQMFHHAGLPQGVVNVVTGTGDVVGEELLRNPKISKVSFTGDTETGKRIMELASAQIKRLTLELGGSDPLIVCDDADMKLAVDGAAFGRFRNSGQGCLCVKRLFLFENIADEFIRRLTEKVSKIKTGNGMDPETKMGPCHTAKQRALVEEQVADAVQRGAKIAIGGTRPSGTVYEHGHFYLPTIALDVDYSSRLAREECFGPALPVFVVRDLEEAIEKANESLFGLSSYVFTRDVNRAISASERISSGKTVVNAAYDSSIELPHGGVKLSGIGRELGLEVFDYYTEPKVIVIDTSTERSPWIPD
jgi:acyl-CoA reductase-like NAD-dependent aldehyde dehydrogenase